MYAIRLSLVHLFADDDIFAYLVRNRNGLDVYNSS